MNREIKFRVWDKVNYLMSEGQELHELKYNQLVSEGTMYKETVEVMQFTGLTDCKGKEIYEGDIIKWWSGQDKDGDHYDYRPITFYQEGNKMGWHLGDIHNRFKSGEHEVVGNIYEHPELLKTKTS